MTNILKSYGLYAAIILMFNGSVVVAQTVENVTTNTEPIVEYIDVTADKLDYNRETGWIEAKGNVVIKKGDQELRAVYVRVNQKTEDAHAFGKVVLKKDGSEWAGDRLDYNFGTRKGSGKGFTGGSDPYRVLNAPMIEGDGEKYSMNDAWITTCTNNTGACHYHLRARSVTVDPGNAMQLRGVSWWMGSVPILYLPYWNKNLDPDFGWKIVPGYKSKMGGFLLTSYYYRLNPAWRGETHVDYRSERGVAFGQDFKWSRPRDGHGDLDIYYIDDKMPVDEDEDLETSNIENQRFRVLLKDQASFSDRDYLLTQVNYLSDTDVLEDFFEGEYRGSHQPENYVSFTHRGDNYAGNILFQGRVNDFYSNVNRLPEVSLEYNPQEIADSSLYWFGRLEGVVLQKVYEQKELSDLQLEMGEVSEEDDDVDYSVFRIDSSASVYRPFKMFGFLNLVPRAGYRGTYYSDTIEENSYSTTSTVQSVQFLGGSTNGVTVTSVETNHVEEIIELGADFRTTYEVGMELSFKAFKTWGEGLLARRHVVEPYANYTYIQEPSVLPDNLYQLDDVDDLDEKHYVKAGFRNKYQIKDDGKPFDIIDLDLFTRYKLTTEPDEEAIDELGMDLEITPNQVVKIDIDAEYDVGLSVLDKFNARLQIQGSEACDLGLEYRLRNEESSLIRADVTFLPKDTWSYNFYGRYEGEESRVEETGAYVIRRLDCMVLNTGVSFMPGYIRGDGTEKDDEVRAVVELWLTAFPGLGVRSRKR